MNLNIKLVLAVRLDAADLRALMLAVTLALHPASPPALGELQRAVAAQFSTWSPSQGMFDARDAHMPLEEVAAGEVW